MKRSIIIIALVVIVLASATAAFAAAWSGINPWSNQRLTYEVKNLQFRMDDAQRNLDHLGYQLTARELHILKCVRVRERDEQACVDALNEFGVTDPRLQAILP
jgi:hypothetical protein